MIKLFLESPTPAEQESNYRRCFDSRRWRLLFKIMFCRPLLSRFGRCRGAFAQIKRPDIASELLRRTERGLTELPVRSNHMIRYAMAGDIGHPHYAPPYLQAENFYLIRERIDRLRLVHADFTTHLASVPPETYSAFNLSDIFEYMNDQQAADLSHLLVRASRPNSRAVFWTMFKSQDVPEDSLPYIAPDIALTESLRKQDKGFFYGSFNLWRIRPKRDTSAAASSSDIAQEVQS